MRTTYDHAFAYELSDGTTVLLRPVTPDDRARLRLGLKWLSERSRYARFNAPLQDLSDGQLRDLTEVDQVYHVAWGALDPAVSDLPGIGVARFVRAADEPSAAELSITVIDAYQRRGVGTTLLALLYLVARTHGVRTLRTTMSPTRRPMVERLIALGGARRFRGGVATIDLPVHEDLDLLGATPEGRRFADVLAGVAAAYGRDGQRFSALGPTLLRDVLVRKRPA